MSQEKYYRLSHFVPKGHPQIYPIMTDEVREMMPFLVEKVSKGWTTIPDHEDLEAFTTLKMGVPALAFRKKNTEVYVHIFCNEFMNPVKAFQMVISLYTKFSLGKPSFKTDEPNWIHSIPIKAKDLNEAETILIHQITRSLFGTVYMDFKRRS
jgi:hypothetical protein